MAEHFNILCQVVDSILEIGRVPYFTEIASLNTPVQAAENSSEVEIVSANGKKYKLSIYDEEA